MLGPLLCCYIFRELPLDLLELRGKEMDVLVWLLMCHK